MAARYDYRWLTGHDVALASLVNVETSLASYTVNGINLAPTSQPVNVFPVRTRLMNGAVRGDGMIDHQWVFRDAIPAVALDYIIDTFLVTSSAVVASKAITIYTRQHDRGSAAYARYNAYLSLPQPRDDYEYDRGYIRNLTLTFTNLVAL